MSSNQPPATSNQQPTPADPAAVIRRLQITVQILHRDCLQLQARGTTMEIDLALAEQRIAELEEQLRSFQPPATSN